MAMHVVLGDGEMTRKELTETLKDLWNRAGDEPFWFVVQGKAEPTDTDTALVAWLTKNEIYFEVLTDDEDALSDIYKARQETHVVKRIAQKVTNLLNNSPEDGESADVLALFVSDDSTAEEDRWVNAVVQSAFDAGFKTFALNDGLVEVDLSESEEEEEKPAAKAAPSKRVAKKAAASSKGNGDEEDTATDMLTRDQLEDMDLAQLKEVAAARNIELPARSRMPTYINAILGEDGSETPAAEVSTPPVTITKPGDVSVNGATVEQVAEEAAAIVLERLVAALQT